MSTQITVKLADSLYERAQRFAELNQQELDEVISSFIEAGLADKEAIGEAEEKMVDGTEPAPVLDRELEAYAALHPELKDRYMGKYVAIHHGKLVDIADDLEELAIRTKIKYGDDFVLIKQVRPEIMQTFVMRSPRIARD
jgi:hypothetical protein